MSCAGIIDQQQSRLHVHYPPQGVTHTLTQSTKDIGERISIKSYLWCLLDTSFKFTYLFRFHSIVFGCVVIFPHSTTTPLSLLIFFVPSACGRALSITFW